MTFCSVVIEVYDLCPGDEDIAGCSVSDVVVIYFVWENGNHSRESEKEKERERQTDRQRQRET